MSHKSRPNFLVGDAVTLVGKSATFFSGPRPSDAMPITGVIMEVDLSHYEGRHLRPWRIKFEDNRESWYDCDEFVGARKRKLWRVAMPVPDTACFTGIFMLGGAHSGTPLLLESVHEGIGNPWNVVKYDAVFISVVDLWNLPFGIVPQVIEKLGVRNG